MNDHQNPACGPEMTQYEQWLASRPPQIQAMAKRWAHDVFYTLNGDGDVYEILAYNENGTVRVLRRNGATLAPMWGVFGVNPQDLKCLVPDDLSSISVNG